MALNAATAGIEEESTAWLGGVIYDEDGSRRGFAEIDALLATLCDKTTKVIINSREHQSILGDGTTTPATRVNGGWVDSSGTFELILRPADNVVVGTVESGQEQHELLLTMVRENEGTGSLTGAMVTTLDSATVTVTHAGHGLLPGDHVTLVGSSSVGGLNCNGMRVVATVPGSNSYTFEHGKTATSAETSSGSVTYFLKGYVSRQLVPVPVIALAKVPN